MDKKGLKLENIDNVTLKAKEMEARIIIIIYIKIKKKGWRTF